MRRKSNTAFVKQLMEFSPYGALAQLFIIDAITKHAELMSQMDADAAEKSGNWGLISPHAWKAVATDIKRQLDERPTK